MRRHQRVWMPVHHGRQRPAANGSNAAKHVAANPGTDKCLFNPAEPTKGINFTTGGSCTANAADGDVYGDILVVSAFTGGGNQPNITAYEWIGSTRSQRARERARRSAGRPRARRSRSSRSRRVAPRLIAVTRRVRSRTRT